MKNSSHNFDPKIKYANPNFLKKKWIGLPNSYFLIFGNKCFNIFILKLYI